MYLHDINKDDFGALMEIIAILPEQAMEFEKKHHQIPCHFINGADFLVKKFPSRFLEMVTYCVNDFISCQTLNQL